MSDVPEEVGGVFLGFDKQKYDLAIQMAPPNTLIKMGDLEHDLVQCSLCGAQMERKHTQFHKHPKKCGACKKEYDENTHKHTPIHVTHPRGAGDVTFTQGCSEEAL